MKRFLNLVFLLIAVTLQMQALTPVRQRVLKNAETYLNVRERGTNEGIEINKFLESAGLSPGYAWCAAFVNYIYMESGANHPAQAAAWSPTWFPAKRIVDKPQDGDVFGIYYDSKQRIAHVGIIYRYRPNEQTVITIEGNTNNSGSRDGDGVYKKRRVKRQLYQCANWIDEPPNTLKYESV